MNTSLPIPSTLMQSHKTPRTAPAIPAIFATFVRALTRVLFACDDPAALRYAGGGEEMNWD